MINDWRRTLGILLFLAGLLALSGCAVFRPVVDPTRFYILDVAANESFEEVAGEGGGITLGMGRFHVARYLDAPGIAIREGDNRIFHSERHRWIESLEHGVARLVGDSLQRDPRVGLVTRHSERGRHLPDYDLNLSILRAEGVTAHWTGSHGVFHANWELRSGSERKVISSGQVREEDLTWNGHDFEQLVASLSRGVVKLSEDVARALEELQTE